MESRAVEAVWLTDDNEFTFSELAGLSGLSESELRELVDYGAIVPVEPESSQWVFKGKSLTTIRVACRLRESFELEPHGVALIISLLDRIHDLESELRSARAQTPGMSNNL